MNPKQMSRSSIMGSRILAVVILCAIGVSCNSPLASLFPTATPLPAWRTPIEYLFLTEEDLPQDWESNFPGPIPKPDPTINVNAREFYKVGHHSTLVYQTIWRAYTIKDARKLYLDRRKNEFRTPQQPIPEYHTYCEFVPPSDITFKSQVADEFYLACGTWDISYCEVLARYRNYVTILRIDIETECNSEHHEGLTYLDTERIIRAMDARFEEFLQENPLDSP